MYSEFDKCYNKEKSLIEWIKVNEIKVLNRAELRQRKTYSGRLTILTKVEIYR